MISSIILLIIHVSKRDSLSNSYSEWLPIFPFLLLCP